MAVTVIEDDLAAWLESRAQVAAAGARVYPFGAVPQAAAFPFVTYHRVYGGRVRSTKGPVGVSRPLLQIDVFGKTYKSCKLLAADVRELLDGLSGETLSGRVVQVAIAEDQQGPADDGDAREAPPHGDEVAQYRETIPLRIWFQES